MQNDARSNLSCRSCTNHKAWQGLRVRLRNEKVPFSNGQGCEAGRYTTATIESRHYFKSYKYLWVCLSFKSYYKGHLTKILAKPRKLNWSYADMYWKCAGTQTIKWHIYIYIYIYISVAYYPIYIHDYINNKLPILTFDNVFF